MDVRFLLLFFVVFGISLCKQSSPSPVPPFQRASFTLHAPSVELFPKRSSHVSYGLAGEEENGRPERFITTQESESVHTGVSLSARQLLSIGKQKFLDDKEEPEKRDHEHSAVSTSSEQGISSNAKLLDEITPKLTVNETNPVDEETHSTDVRKNAPPPSSKPEDKTPTSTEGKGTDTLNVDKTDEPSKDDSTHPETKPNQSAIRCGESHCEDPKKLVSACLQIPGDGAHKLSLFITNGGDSEATVKVVAPEYLVADPAQVSVPKGKSATIQIMMDTKYETSMLEGMKNKNITVTTVYGDCEIAVPMEYLRNSAHTQKPQLSSYLPLVTPRVVVYLFVFVLIVVLIAAWSCYKCCAKKRASDAVKYQQLEMIVPGQSTPKERAEGSTDPWDEVWDEDWEDAEAAKSSARLSQNLSSRGLAARRGNKDGWDTSWED